MARKGMIVRMDETLWGQFDGLCRTKKMKKNEAIVGAIKEMLSNERGKTERAIVGIGGAGGNFIIRFIRSSPVFDADVYRVDTDASHLSAYTESARVMNIAVSPKKGSIGSGLTDAIKKYSSVILVVGLGGKTGTRGARELSSLCREKKIKCGIIAMLPFELEHRRSKIAKRALNELMKDHILTLMDNGALVRSKPDSPMSEAFAYTDNAIGTFIDAIFELSESGVAKGTVCTVSNSRSFPAGIFERMLLTDRYLHFKPKEVRIRCFSDACFNNENKQAASLKSATDECKRRGVKVGNISFNPGSGGGYGLFIGKRG